MSWLARSLVNSLRGEEEDEVDDHEPRKKLDADEISHKSSTAEGEEDQRPIEPGTPTRGVKEDLSDLTKTITRQFWGVASFLAPPPAESSPSDRGRPSDPFEPTVSGVLDEAETADSPRLARIRSDFAEIGGRFKTGISILSSTKAVSEISKIASTFLPFGSEEEDEGEGEESEDKSGSEAVGVTDEVLAFARNISMHPETWLDFPLIPDDEDSDEFDMSDAQQEHALAVERLAPRLAALRIELCPTHMSEGRFWKIYFVLLHSRLNRHDAELLMTPQVVQARAMLLQDLQNRTKPNSEGSGRGLSSFRKEVVTSVPSEENVISPSNSETLPTKTLTLEEPTTSFPMTDLETEKHTVRTTEVKIIDKSVIEEDPSVQAKSRDIHSDASNIIPIQRYEGDGDDWLEEETSEVGGSGGTAIPMENEEDISFSDLEEDDDQGEPKNYKKMTPAIDPQPKDSREGWVQLNKNSEDAAKGGNSTTLQIKESNDWLSLDDIDVE